MQWHAQVSARACKPCFSMADKNCAQRRPRRRNVRIATHSAASDSVIIDQRDRSKGLLNQLTFGRDV
jgi:hypothetical protein